MLIPDSLQSLEASTLRRTFGGLQTALTRYACLSKNYESLSEVDRDLIGLVAARQKIVAEIGTHKIQNSVPTRDYEREREVLKAAETQARALGLEPGLAGEIMGLLIRASLTHQEQRRVAAGTSGAGKRVLIIGGAGKMGVWFAHFLGSQGFAIEVADPNPAPVPFTRVDDWREAALDHDLIIVATPMKVAGDVLSSARDEEGRAAS